MYDEHGMLYSTMGVRDTNGMLFTCQNAIMKMALGSYTAADNIRMKKMVEAHKIGPGIYAQVPWDKNDPASHDNITGMVAWSVMAGEGYHMTLNILRQPKLWHPRDLAFYNYCKHLDGPCAGFFKMFLIVTDYAQRSTFKDTYKERPHGIFVDTDGKLLAVCRSLMAHQVDGFERLEKSWGRCLELLDEKSKIFDYETKSYVDLSTVNRVFRHYFKQTDHYNNLLADMIWGKVN